MERDYEELEDDYDRKADALKTAKDQLNDAWAERDTKIWECNDLDAELEAQDQTFDARLQAANAREEGLQTSIRELTSEISKLKLHAMT